MKDLKIMVELTDDAKKHLAEFIAAVEKFGKDVEKAVAGKSSAKPEEEPEDKGNAKGKAKGKSSKKDEKKKEEELKALGKKARDDLRLVFGKKGEHVAKAIMEELGVKQCHELDEAGLKKLVKACAAAMKAKDKEEDTGGGMFD